MQYKQAILLWGPMCVREREQEKKKNRDWLNGAERMWIV